jgi:hypothetical protein
VERVVALEQESAGGVQELHKCSSRSSLLEEVHKICMAELHYCLSEWCHDVHHTVSSENFILDPTNSSSGVVCHMNHYCSDE